MSANSPIVSVIEIKAGNVPDLIDLGFDMTTFLDSQDPHATGGKPEDVLTSYLQAFSAQSTRAFFLTWKGSKIPRGAIIQGHRIAWTQNGVVTSEAGEMIGTYERLVEFGPEDLQQMIVYYIGKVR
jgi:hypothetical protein